MAGHEKRPLVTVLGASGLLGTAIARELASQPIRLRLVGRRPTAVPARRQAEVEVRTVDLTEPGAVAAAVADADAVIHLVAYITGPSTWRVAATDPVAERVNLGLVEDLVRAIAASRPARPPVVLFAGSMSQLGRPSAARIDGTEVDAPLTAYDQQKLAAEQILQAATEEGVIRGATLRLATLYSQGIDSAMLDRGVVAAMTRRAFADQPLTMWHTGTVTRDLLCIDDAARAFVAALDQEQAVTGRHWLVGTGVATSVAELFGMIAKVVSTHTGRPAVPVLSVSPPKHSAETDLIDYVLDPAVFEAATGWSARVPLMHGLDGLAAAIARETATNAGETAADLIATAERGS
ncbi:NAD-dependent epimerase/dehydratase [Actinoplanes sp. NEAU-A12]|uniref:NAD-dependent epimerase/dehydratase n=1 Tax=Actinoplanes sandaracinus TaxID=3045177 RepID=A0ABT6WZK8_9ACTN|nr:NAD-dependent epimerase/dehydratase [Actinoplanes sandaracinus]MDI6105159.1 NAD-dependent epimerase/dehydratase [Actinoplanes sandaracinus]